MFCVVGFQQDSYNAVHRCLLLAFYCYLITSAAVLYLFIHEVTVCLTSQGRRTLHSQIAYLLFPRYKKIEKKEKKVEWEAELLVIRPLSCGTSSQFESS